MIKNNRLPHKKYISIKKQVFSHKIRLASVFQLKQGFFSTLAWFAYRFVFHSRQNIY